MTIGRFHFGVLIFVLTVIGIAPEGWAQDSDGVVRKVDVKVIRPADLPKAQESEIPEVLSGNAPLPRAPNISDIIEARGKVLSRIFQIVVIYPKGRYHRDRLLARGHAVWISAEKNGGRPVLVTPLHWVEGADEIYAIPWPEADTEIANLPRARVSSMDTALTHNSAKAFLKHRKDRVALTLHSPDPHRNLVTLLLAPKTKDAKKVDPKKTAWLKVPTAGLQFFDISRHSATQIFGMSPMVSPNPLQTAITSTHEAELIYYLQCDFQGALGAPIFGMDGGLIGVTAMRHPVRPQYTLVVPPLALRKYVERVQGISEDERVKKVKKK